MPETQDWAAGQANPPLFTNTQGIAATEAGVGGSLRAASGNNRWVLNAAYAVTDPSAAASQIVRGMVLVEVLDNVFGNVLLRMIVSPDNPFCQAVTPFGAVKSGLAGSLDYFARSEPGAGTQAVVLFTSEYLASV